MTRFRDIRETVLKNIQTPDPKIAATPRWLSPFKSGYLIAQNLEVEPPSRVSNRRNRRANMKGRNRLPGVALKEKPWSAK